MLLRWNPWSEPRQGLPAAYSEEDIADRLAAERRVTLVGDKRLVSDVRQHAMRAIAGQCGKVILDRDPSLLSPGGSREDDQRACAQGPERPRLPHGDRSFGPFI